MVDRIDDMVSTGVQIITISLPITDLTGSVSTSSAGSLLRAFSAVFSLLAHITILSAKDFSLIAKTKEAPNNPGPIIVTCLNMKKVLD
jgi:hypothetical protein